jgi:hypothetical protein
MNFLLMICEWFLTTRVHTNSFIIRGTVQGQREPPLRWFPHLGIVLFFGAEEPQIRICTSLHYTHTKELGESVADARRRHFQAGAKMLGDVDDVVFRLARPKIMLQKSNT